MSLIPFILDLADELHDFNRCLTTGMDVDDFGFGIYPHEFQQQPLQQQHQLRRPRGVSQLYWLPNTKQRHHPYYRSKACCGNKTPSSSQLNDPEKEAASDKDGAAPNTGTAAGKSAYSVVNRNGFQVSMNVKQFTPNELTVKTIDNCIVVEGRHEDKEDGHGVISRHFIRKYMLPKGYDPNEVLSTLSSDGILTVKAPPPTTKADEHSERIVDIQQTGPAQTNSAAKDTSKEQTNTTKAAAAEAAAPAAAAPPQQQPLELQKPKPKQQPELQKVANERNGDSNSKEINAEQETEPEPAAAAAVVATASEQEEEEQPMLVSNIVVAPAAVDAIMAAATANEGNEQDANVNNNNDNGIADIPVAIASDVDMETIPEAASATVVAVVEELVDGLTDGASVVVVEAAVENLVVAEKAPTAADLVAAADAAIILAKTQCENGNKTATASSEEGVAN